MLTFLKITIRAAWGVGGVCGGQNRVAADGLLQRTLHSLLENTSHFRHLSVTVCMLMYIIVTSTDLTAFGTSRCVWLPADESELCTSPFHTLHAWEHTLHTCDLIPPRSNQHIWCSRHDNRLCWAEAPSITLFWASVEGGGGLVQLSADYMSVYLCAAWSLLTVHKKVLPISFPSKILKIEVK